MCNKNQEHCERRILLVAVSAAVLVGSFGIGSQFVQPSIAQDLGQMGQQAERDIVGGAEEAERDIVGGAEEAERDIVGGLEQLAGGNQTGNQTGNQSG